MECPVCGRYAPPDPDTGYDGDDICSTCAAEGFTIMADGNIGRAVPMSANSVSALELMQPALETLLDEHRRYGAALNADPGTPDRIPETLADAADDEEDPPCPF